MADMELIGLKDVMELLGVGIFVSTSDLLFFFGVLIKLLKIAKSSLKNINSTT